MTRTLRATWDTAVLYGAAAIFVIPTLFGFLSRLLETIDP
jgi:hypothetical protein